MHRSWIIPAFLLSLLLPGCGDSSTSGADETPEDRVIETEEETAPPPTGIGSIGEESGDWQLEGSESPSDPGESSDTGGFEDEDGETPGEESGNIPGEETGDPSGEETGDPSGEETGDNPSGETGGHPSGETGGTAAAKGCDADALETIEATLTFPSVGPGCPWGEGANLSPSDYLVRACITQEKKLPIPDGSILCSLSVNVGVADGGPPSSPGGSCQGLCSNGGNPQATPNGDCFCDQACSQYGDCCNDYDYWCVGGSGGTPFGYDDHFVLVFDDSVLVSSTSAILQDLDESSGMLLYDWEKLKNTNMFSSNNAFCHAYGQDGSTCQLPGDGGQQGSLSLQFTEKSMASALTSPDSSGSFRLVVVGDNDPSTDCYHSGMSIDVIATIAPAP